MKYDPTKKFIQVHRCVVLHEHNGKKLGINSAYLYSELSRWFRIMKYDWFYKDSKSLQNEIGMSKKEIDTAKNRLIDAGLIKHKISKVSHEPFKGATLSHYYLCSHIENGVVIKGEVPHEYDINGVGNVPKGVSREYPKGISGSTQRALPSITQQDNTIRQHIDAPHPAHQPLMKYFCDLFQDNTFTNGNPQKMMVNGRHGLALKRMLKTQTPDAIKSKARALLSKRKTGDRFWQDQALTPVEVETHWNRLTESTKINTKYNEFPSN